MEQVELCNAQKDAVMMGTLWPHIGFNLGGRKYYCDVIEADIHDSLILGIDFLRGNKCKVDLGNDTLEFGNGDIVHAHMRSDVSASAFHISRLVVRKKLSLPPNSVVYVDAKMESPANVPFAFEPVDNLAQKKLFMMPGMTQGDETVQVAVLNLADVHVKLRRNQELAHAVEVDAMLDMKAEKGGNLFYMSGKMARGECKSLNSIKCVSLGSQVVNTLMLLWREMSRVTWKQRRARTPGVLVAH